MNFIMTKPMKFVVYELHGPLKNDEGVDLGVDGILARVVRTDDEEKVCLGGEGKDGVYYYYDSSIPTVRTISYHFKQEFNKHGLWVDTYEMEIPMSAVSQYKV